MLVKENFAEYFLQYQFGFGFLDQIPGREC